MANGLVAETLKRQVSENSNKNGRAPPKKGANFYNASATQGWAIFGHQETSSSPRFNKPTPAALKGNFIRRL